MVDTRSEYDELYAIYWPVGIAVLVIVTAAIVFVALRWRSGSNELPKGRDHATGAEVLYATGLAAIAAVLVALTYSTMSALKTDDPAEASAAAVPGPGGPPVPIKVTASRWNWRFEYPEQGISDAGGPGRLPELVVPVGSVRFELTSLDVIHSFFVASVRFKRDAFPEHVNAFTLAFTRPGLERGGGQCAEYCGLRHSYMDFDVRVVPPQEFERWARTRAGTRGGAA